MEWNESAPLVVQNVVTPLSSLHRSICDGVHDIPSAVRALMDKHFIEEDDWEKIDISVVDIMGSTILSQGSYQSSSSSPSLQETYQEKINLYKTILLPSLQQSVMKYDYNQLERPLINWLGREINNIQVSSHLIQAPPLTLPMRITDSFQLKLDRKSIQNLCENRNKNTDTTDDININNTILIQLFLDISCPLIVSASSPKMMTSYSFGAHTESQCMYLSYNLHLLDLYFTSRVIPISGKWRSTLLDQLRRHLIESYRQLFEKRRLLKMTHPKEELKLHCLSALQDINKGILLIDDLIGDEYTDTISAMEHNEIPQPFKLAIMKGEKFLNNENRWKGSAIFFFLTDFMTSHHINFFKQNYV